MVEPEGVICDIAGTAAGARTLLARHTYRLMLLDLTLPDTDGLTFLQELRVAAALTKSMTSNEQLLATIKRTLGMEDKNR